MSDSETEQSDTGVLSDEDSVISKVSSVESEADELEGEVGTEDEIEAVSERSGSDDDESVLKTKKLKKTTKKPTRKDIVPISNTDPSAKKKRGRPKRSEATGANKDGEVNNKKTTSKTKAPKGKAKGKKPAAGSDDAGEDEDAGITGVTAGDERIDESLFEKIANRELVLSSDDEDDSDEDEDATFQKLANSKYAEKVAQTFYVHERPSDEEVRMMTIIHRDERGNICDPLHTTLPVLTIYERTRVLSERVMQLNAGAEPLVPVAAELRYDNYNTAVKELESERLPLVIQRPMPNRTCEYWNLQDLLLI
jgi:DNA-directed RNA polymerase subunit K/omega